MQNFLDKIFIGTSGWSYPEWKNIIYPKNISHDKMLQYYSFFFKTVEINSSFYRIPTKKLVKNWLRTTPESFLFSVKLPQEITHKAVIDILESKEYIIKTIESFSPMLKMQRLFAFLLQLPPRFGNQKDLDKKKLINFIQYWNSEIEPLIYEYLNEAPSLVVEFRNKYWDRNDIYETLRQNNCTFCAVIEPLFPPKFEITSNDLFYIRFHGFNQKSGPWFNYNFSDNELEYWYSKFKGLLEKLKKNSINIKKIAIYFNNHFNGNAVKNAIDFSKKLNIKLDYDKKHLKKPIEFFINREKNQKKIDEFF